MALDIRVVIPTARRAKLLARTLASLADCELPAGYQETIVVENGKRGSAEEIVAEAPPAIRPRHIHVAQGNKSEALNEVLAAVSDESLLIFFDDDIRIAHDTLSRYAIAADSAGEARYFGGPFQVDYEQAPPVWLRRFLPLSAIGWSMEESAARPEYFLGFNWAAIAGDLRRAGGFDANFGPGSSTGSSGQETDMQQRLRAIGVLPQYVPGAMVWHYVPRSRSTPDWALTRAWKTGIERGLMHGGNGLTIAGAPPTRYWRAARRAARFGITRILPSEAARF